MTETLTFGLTYASELFTCVAENRVSDLRHRFLSKSFFSVIYKSFEMHQFPAPSFSGPPSQIHKLINLRSSCELSRLLTFALQFIDFQDVTSTQIILRPLLGRKSSFASSDTHFIKVWSRQTTIQIRRNFFEPNY